MPKPNPGAYSLRSWPRARVDRFLRFVDRQGPDECWPWTGSRGARGQARYQFRVNGRLLSVYAPRLVWVLTHGPLRGDREVIHRCLDVACCNPAHLLAGTPARRCGLLVTRGRSIAGTRHPGAKLHPSDVRRLLALKREHPDLTGRDLARRMGLRSRAWVNAILRGAAWLSVDVERLGPQPKGPKPRPGPP